MRWTNRPTVNIFTPVTLALYGHRQKVRASEAVYLKRFLANPSLSGEPTRGFQVKLARNGVILDAGQDETILIQARHFFGTCVTNVIDGNADQRDSFFKLQNNTHRATRCVSESRA